MAGDLALIARLLAYRQGHAFPRASHVQVAVQPDAYVLCPLAMAGEDTTVHIAAYGRVGEQPRILYTPEPRKRDDQYLLFETLGAELEGYFDQQRRAGTARRSGCRLAQLSATWTHSPTAFATTATIRTFAASANCCRTRPAACRWRASKHCSPPRAS